MHRFALIFCTLQITWQAAGWVWTSKSVFVNSKRPIQFGTLRLLHRWHLGNPLLKPYAAFWNIKIINGWSIHWTVRLLFRSNSGQSMSNKLVFLSDNYRWNTSFSSSSVLLYLPRKMSTRFYPEICRTELNKYIPLVSESWLHLHSY